MQNDIKHLKQKIKILDAENEQLVGRAEDLLLISLISDNIESKKTESAILEQVIQNISMVKNYEFTAIGQLENNLFTILHSYRNSTKIPSLNKLKFKKSSVVKLNSHAYLESTLKSIVTDQTCLDEKFVGSKILLLPFDGKNENSYYLAIITNQKINSLESAVGTLQQVIQISSTKIENIYLVSKLQDYNKYLEVEVKNRTDLLLKEMSGNEAISKLIRILLKSRSLWEISNLVMQTALNLTNSKEAIVCYKNEVTGNLESLAFTENLKDLLIFENDTFVVNRSDTFFSRELTNKKILVINDIVNEKRKKNDPIKHVIIRNFLTAPVIVDNKIIGQISLGNSLKDYSNEDENFIEDLAAIFGIALHRLIAEKDLNDAKESAEKANLMKSEFLAQMSHEIRTPLNSILNFTSLIKDTLDNNLDEDIREGFSVIDRSSRRLIRTIDSILNISLLQSDSYDLKIKECKLDKIIDEVLADFKHIAKDKSIDLQIDFTESSIIVEADEYALSQTFANLVDNAIKYTESGFVKISCNCLEDKLKVIIEDSGIGMSDSFLSNLFDPFVQEETGYTRKYEGAGLGLSLVKKYCELNEIQIFVSSKKNIGTKFTLEFPDK